MELRRRFNSLDQTQSVEEGHFDMGNGFHSGRRFNPNALIPFTIHARLLCQDIILNSNGRGGVRVVIGPGANGAVLASHVAGFLTTINQQDVLAVSAERENGGFKIHDGQSIFCKGVNAFVMTDTITTGGTVMAVIKEVSKAGGMVIGVGALCNYGHISAGELGIGELVSVRELDFPIWPVADCPMCKLNMPMNRGIHGPGKVIKLGKR